MRYNMAVSETKYDNRPYNRTKARIIILLS
jgi:hypothetical protein